MNRLERAYKDANTLGGKLRGTLGNMFGPEAIKMAQSYALGLTGAGESQAAINTTLGDVSNLAGELRLPDNVVAQAFADALRASGGKVAPALSATRLAGQYLADQPMEMGEFAGSMVDMAKVTGSSDTRVNFELLAMIA